MKIFIHNGTIIDGNGVEKFGGDVRIADGRIVDVGSLKPKKSEHIIDATGLYVTPGFVDINCQSDLYGSLFSMPNQASLVRQGITTVVVGNNGFSPAPLFTPYQVSFSYGTQQLASTPMAWRSFDEYLQVLTKTSFGVNVCSLIGYSSVYRGVVGTSFRTVGRKQEQDIMDLLQRGIEQGAFGVSFDLADAYVSTLTPQQVKRIMNMVVSKDGLYATTLRNKKEFFYDSFQDIASLARDTSVNIEFSHPQPEGAEYHDQYTRMLEMMDKQDNMSFDVYPYTVTASYLVSFLPKWVARDNIDEVLSDSSKHKKLVDEINKKYTVLQDAVLTAGIISVSWIGKKIGDIAQRQEKSVGEVVVDILKMKQKNVTVFASRFEKKSLLSAIQHSKSMISTHGMGYDLDLFGQQEYIPHPRSFGTMPAFLHTMALKDDVLSIEEAVHKVSYAPAKKLGLSKRGKIEPSYYADIAVWDPHRFVCMASYDNPYRYAQGMEYVIVNGKIAFQKADRGIHLFGRVLKKI